MHIIFKRSFQKSFSKLSMEDQDSVNDTLDIFQENPLDPKLKNHTLKGTMVGMRSISAGFDLRIIYREEWNHAVVYLMKAGTHTQVYED